VLVFDSEANGLMWDVTKIHVISLSDEKDDSQIDTYFDAPQVGKYKPAGSIDEAIRFITNYNGYVVGHNIAGYDIPMFKKIKPDLTKHLPPLMKYSEGVTRLLDTYALSCLLYPQQKKHGLDYWGEKLGVEKPVQDQWHTLDESMIHRNREDVKINKNLLKHLKERREKCRDDTRINWVNAIDTEQDIMQIHAIQLREGVRYNIMKAIETEELLGEKEGYLAKVISTNAPPIITKNKTPVSKPYKMDGNFSKMTLDHFGSEYEARSWNIKGPFTRIGYTPLNPDSDDQLKKYMLSLGWKPTEWNKSKKTGLRTSPKLTEDSYASLPPGLGQQIAEYNIVTHRRGMILNRKEKEKGGLWVVDPRTGRLPAEAFTCGTPTARYRHSGVVCNIPRKKKAYGEIIRSLFCVPEIWWLLGLDLKGIEIRMIAHFCYDYPGGREMAEEILYGDFHQANADFWGVDREISKVGLFSLCYGCEAPTLASQIGKPMNEAKYLFDIFWEKRRPIKLLSEDLKRSYKANGCLIGLDGRRVSVREERKLLNTCIQGASAVVFKNWLIKNYLTTVVKKLNDIVVQVIAYHDEGQWECRNESEDFAKYVGTLFQDNSLGVGRDFRINVPIAADVKTGKNWAETH
jgi:DNA polymerase I-like protein with 3'-5' exonuclease and polymerase domains